MSFKLFRDARHHLAQLIGLEPTALDEHKCTFVEEAHCTECGADCSEIPVSQQIFQLIDRIPVIECEAKLHPQDEETVMDMVVEIMAKLPIKAAERMVEKLSYRDQRGWTVIDLCRFSNADNSED
jgi:hypothetical protein